MPSRQHNRSFFNALTLFLVVLILAGAFTLSGRALLENMRFTKAADQIFWLAGQARAAANDQKSFAQTPGDDIWAGLATLGRITAATPRLNAWNGAIRPTATVNGIRIESDVPTHECRRLALYFIDRKPLELGLVSIEAQSAGDAKWGLIYPLTGASASRTAMIACGAGTDARLALVFKIR